MRELAIAGIVTVAWISLIMAGSDMRATLSVFSNVGRNALQNRDGTGAGLFSDASLRSIGHVHDDATFESEPDRP